MARKSRESALLEGIAAGMLFGTAAIFIRLIEINAFSIALWRLVIAAIVLSLMIFALREKVRFTLTEGSLKSFLFLGTLLGTHFILFVSAVKETTVLNAAVLVNTTPIFSMIISTFLYRIKPSRFALIGIVLSFVGAGVIAFGDAEKGDHANLMGDLAAMLAAVAEGFYLNYGKEKRNQLSILPTMLLIYLGAALTVGVTTLLLMPTSAKIGFEVPNNFETFILIIGLGIMPTAIAHTLYFSSLSNLKSFETATMALLEPLVATFLSAAIFSEIPAPIFVLGAAFVLAGILSLAIGD